MNIFDGTLIDEPGQDRAMAMVEYLDYDVFADHGWSLEDDDLFEKAGNADLDESEYGYFEVPDGEYILGAAEVAGLD